MNNTNTKSKSLKQLKQEGKEPEMKPNGTHRGDSFIYIPVNQKYYDWYYSDRQKAKRKSKV